MPGGEFSLFKTFAHLEDGPGASEVAVSNRFWEEIGAPADLQGRAPRHGLPLETFAKLRRGEERRPLALGTGRRRGVLPPLPLGEGWGEGGGRRGPHDLAEARPPSYAKVSSGGD